MMKRNKIWSLLIVFLLVFNASIFTGNISLAATSEGDGTPQSPYLIKTLTDLYRIQFEPSAYYKLANDLDFKNSERYPMFEFNGTLIGDGHTIRNLTLLPQSKTAGLFSTTKGAKIEYIKFSNITINSDIEFAGVIAGIAINSQFVNCTITDSNITNQFGYTGGLVGSATENCFFYQCLSMNNNINASIAGGIAGYGYNEIVFVRCYSNSALEGKKASSVGGLLGQSLGGTKVILCHTTGPITGSYIGGLIGIDNSVKTSIEDSYSLCNLNSTGTDTSASGLIGYTITTEGIPLIKNSYFAGEILGNTRFGLAPSGDFQNSYFDQTKTGLTTPIGSSRTTKQMYEKSNYTNWNFISFWIIEDGKNYPELLFLDDVLK